MNQNNFVCLHCREQVSDSAFMGTISRNHCPFCLWSKHVDREKPGDRSDSCGGAMEPIGLTFKRKSPDKYGKKQLGELMLVHHCLSCGKISLNRLAGDDEVKIILKIFEKSLKINPEEKRSLSDRKISLLQAKDRKQIEIQLLGKIF